MKQHLFHTVYTFGTVLIAKQLVINNSVFGNCWAGLPSDCLQLFLFGFLVKARSGFTG